MSEQERDDEQPEGQPRDPIYNVDGLHGKLEDIAWTDEVPWEETLAITTEQPTVVHNVDDDLERELAFYNQVGTLVGSNQPLTAEVSQVQHRLMHRIEVFHESSCTCNLGHVTYVCCRASLLSCPCGGLLQ